MSVDPTDYNDEQLKQELDQQLSEISQDELDRMVAQSRPVGSTAPDQRGRLDGTIVAVRGEDVFVDIGGRSEAFLPLSEFDTHHPPEPGQTLSFVMHGIESESGLMRLSLKETLLVADLSSMQVGDVIEARVTGVNIGGLELSASNEVRAFMPKSQVELERVEDFTPYLGRPLECEIAEINRKGRNLVVSRRKLLERQREEQARTVRDTLSEGQTVDGVVRRLTDFGAFVDLGGLDGLLRVGDLSYRRIGHPKDVLQINQQIQVKILKIDPAKNRISLGLKQLSPDPWALVDANYRSGATVDGRVTSLMNFGAFVELEEGVEGLIPISEMSWTQHVRHPKEILSEGDSVRVSVISVDVDKHRIGLSLKALGEDPWNGVADRYTPDSVVSGAVTRLADFGAFVQLEQGVEGLVHVSEMSDKHIRTPSDAAKVGDVVRVRVKSVDPEQRRIALSMRVATQPAEPADAGAGPLEAKPKKRKRPLRGGLD